MHDPHLYSLTSAASLFLYDLQLSLSLSCTCLCLCLCLVLSLPPTISAVLPEFLSANSVSRHQHGCRASIFIAGHPYSWAQVTQVSCTSMPATSCTSAQTTIHLQGISLHNAIVLQTCETTRYLLRSTYRVTSANEFVFSLSSISAREFLALFRLTRVQYDVLLQSISQHPALLSQQSLRKKKVPAAHQLLVFLNFFGSHQTLSQVALRFKIGLGSVVETILFSIFGGLIGCESTAVSRKYKMHAVEK